jgi:hypothetical protein
MSRAVRAENILSALAAELKLSAGGRLAVENAIDPFPDTRRPTCGWPDASVNATVTPKDKQSFTFSTGSSGYTGTYDMHIFNSPIIWNASVQSGAASGSTTTFTQSGGNSTNFVTVAASGTFTVAVGVTIITVPAGTPLNLQTFGINPALGFNIFRLTTPPSYVTDSMRVISGGIEIHDNTAALTAQGAITIYRQPVNSSRYSQTLTANDLNFTSFTGAYVATPPPTTARALALADSAQWLAKKGAYLPLQLQSSEVPYNVNNFTQPIWYNNFPSDVVQGSGPFATVSSNLYAFQNLWTEFAMSGAILTGLSNSCAITINTNFIYEIQAAGQSVLLENMATPSPPLDNRALQVLAMLHHLLPIGVEVDRNGLGDWISSAANAVKNAIAPTMRMVAPMLVHAPHPGLKAIGVAGLMMGQKTKNLTEAQREKLIETGLKGITKKPKTGVTPTLAAASRQRINQGNKHAQNTPTAGNITNASSSS